MDYFITKYDAGQVPDSECAVLEDTIMHKGHPVTAGSRMLEEFVSPFDATVVTRLEAADVAILGKSRMDEFGAAGLFLDWSQAVDGAVSAVSDGAALFALCNDYTGAIRRQAVARGVCYIHPTYGTVSRYGLIPAVPSMDQIGVICKNPTEGFRVLSIMAGHDPKDGAMFPDEYSAEPGEKREEKSWYAQSTARNEAEASAKSGELREQLSRASVNESAEDVKLRIGVPVNVLSGVEDVSAVEGFVKSFETKAFTLKYFDMFSLVMQVLCCAELSSSICRYDGVKFGFRAGDYKNLNELYTKSRTQAFSTEVKFAAIVGAMALSHENYNRYYDKAMRIRRLILESLRYDNYDAIVMPAPTTDSGIAYHALPQLCGLPAVTFPFNGGGVTLIAGARREKMLIKALKAVGL